MRSDPVELIVERKPVSSTSIKSIGCNEQTRTLEVEFASGRVYQYLSVPPEVYEAFLKAESKGRFYASNFNR